MFSNYLTKDFEVKHPLWIVNSTLLVLVILSVLFVYWSRVETPPRTSIEPFRYTKINRALSTDINIKKIYEEDLFDTYHQEVVPVKPVEEVQVTFPEPPEPTPPVVPVTPEPSFLDPLDITLKGIVIIGGDNSRSTALIADKSNTERIYRVGDVFEDASLVRILNNKIIFLRSNGQQEVLYVRAEDAKEDAIFTNKDEWARVVVQDNADSFIVDQKTFVKQVKSLAQFIDMLHLTTVYEKGKSIGCRIGTLDDKSLGMQMGLQSGDIITKILNIETGPVENRMKIYQAIINTPSETAIEVVLLRKGVPKTLTFIVRGQAAASTSSTPQETLQKPKNDERINTLKEKYKVAPTLQEIRQSERKHMQEQGTTIPTEQPPTP
jgi:type II secretion system protein C